MQPGGSLATVTITQVSATGNLLNTCRFKQNIADVSKCAPTVNISQHPAALDLTTLEGLVEAAARVWNAGQHVLNKRQNKCTLVVNHLDL